MAAAKTKENDASVLAFIQGLESEKQKEEALELLELFKEISGYEARMWGDSIIGFGHYHYRYASGREGEWMRGAFSPRKAKFSLYIMDGIDAHKEQLNKLGKYKTGKACLYIKTLDEIDRQVLRDLIKSSFETMAQKYPL